MKGISRARSHSLAAALALGAALGAGLGCGEEPSPAEAPAPAEPPATAPPAERASAAPLDPAIARSLEAWRGDLPEMRQRGVIRVLVTYDKTNFFFQDGRPRGFEYELLHGFEESLNRGMSRSSLATRLVFLPVPFGQLLPALAEGRGDIAAAGLTVTPERQERVAFTRPYLTDVEEVVVSGPGSEGLASLEDLAGRTVLVSRGRSYGSHLRELSARLQREGREPIRIVEADAGLQSPDMLEMVNAGAVELTVSDRHIAELWSGLLEKLEVRRDLVVHSGARIAWAVRKDSPKLAKAVDAYIQRHRKGTLIGNVLFRRYYQDARWIGNPLSEGGMARLADLETHFRAYADRYGFDWLAIAAQAYQESGFDHRRRSRAGAVGIMQLLPSTAADRWVGIPDIQDVESNIHAGVKYLAFLRDRYFSDDGISPADRFDFALAAYNAGPRNVMRFRDRAEELGLDENRWFRNVEVAALELLGREPVAYVANVNKYYVAYRLAEKAARVRAAARGD